MLRSRLASALWLVSCLGLTALAAVVAGQSQAPPPPPPPVPPTPVIIRDAIRGEVNQTPEPAGTGAIFGTVTSAATGQPVEGVRLTISGGGLHGNQQIVTDDEGRFGFLKLPAGEFTVRASKTGYVNVAYGQKEPRAGWPGTPIALADGQQIKNLSFAIPPGGVITGAIFDEKNRPSIATMVRVLRWSMQSGERTLTSAGSATTDDRGIYRVYGLAPGDYLVTALPRNTTGGDMVFEYARVEATATYFSNMAGTSGGAIAPTIMVHPEGFPAGHDAPEGYAPVYYPGTPQLTTASTISLRSSEERGGVDVRLIRVPMSRVEGQVLMPPGSPIANVQVRLLNIAEQVPGVGTQSTRAGNDGRFRFNGVPPGQYRLFATGDLRETTQLAAAAGQVVRTTTTTRKLWASSEISVGAGTVPDTVLSLVSGSPVSGRVSFEQGTTPLPPDLRRVRLTLSPHGQLTSASGVGTLNVTADADGRFTFANVIPGLYRLRATGVSGWTMKSALLGGRDLVDFPLEMGQGADASNILVTFGDRTSGLSGTLQDAMGRPTADHMVILFPAQEQYWIPQSRRIQAARPTTNGRFSFSGLPSGEYRLAAVTDVEPGTWFDPAFLRQLLTASITVSLPEGLTRTQDLKVGR